MTVTETLGALGSWEIQLTEETPDYIIGQLGFFGHVAIVDAAVDVDATGAGLLTGARYVGVLRAKDRHTGRKLGGSGMVFWLGDEDGKGDILEAEVSLISQTLSQCVTAIVGPSLALDVGTVFTAAGTYTGKHQFQTRREALSIICDAFNVEFRVNGNGTVDVGTAAQLYNTANPDTIIVRKGAGTDMDLVALGGDYTVDESVYDYSSRVVLLGQTVGTGDTADEVFVTGIANAGSVPYLDLFGNPVKMVRTISESGTTAGSVTARANLQLNRFNRVARSLKVSAEDYETEGNFVVGDNVYVYDPDTGIVNPAVEVPFRGELLHPDVVRASGITWPVVQGMTVAFRTQAGVWLDLTPFVTWETGGNELTIGDLPKSLTNPGDNPIQVRVDAVRADASIPNAPTGLTLTTFSSLNAKGQTIAIIHAAWTAPTLNTDGSTLTDFSHYLVQYRPQFRAPQWQQAPVRVDVSIDLEVMPSIVYDVEVAAVDLGGKQSAFTSVATITSAADALAPNTPADPVVSNYLGQLRIEYAGTDSSGNPMASDTDRIDVHVGTTLSFVASLATRVDSINPFAKGVSYATAPYGSTRYVRLIAVDRTGNSSSSSAVVSGATAQVVSADVFDGAIGSAKLADLAVVTAKIADLAVNDAKIGSLAVGKLTAGIMSADVTISGRFATALTGARVEMNSVGLYKYDASGNQLVAIGPSSGALITGTYRTALTGRRLEMGTVSPSLSQIDFWAADASHTWIRAFTSTAGDEALQFGVGNVVNAAGDNRFSISVASNGNGTFISRFSDHAFTSGIGFNIYTSADNFGTNILQIDSATRQFTIRPTDMLISSAGTFSVKVFPATNVPFTLYLDSTGDLQGLYGTAYFGGFWKFMHSTQAFDTSPKMALFTSAGYGGYLRFVGGAAVQEIEFKYFDDSFYVNARANAFINNSDMRSKESIAEASDVDCLAAIAGTKVKKYKRTKVDKEQKVLVGPEEIGLLAQEAPPQIVIPSTDGTLGVDLYQMSAMEWGAIQQLAGRLDVLEANAKKGAK